MNLLLIICALISFLVTLKITPWFIKYLKNIDLIVKDQNKKEKPLIPISGGIPVLTGFIIAISVFIFFTVFFPHLAGNFIKQNETNLLFASLLSMIIVVFVGLLDDLLVKRNKERSIGLSQWQKPLLTLIAAIPLMVISAGDSTMSIPLVGSVNFGWIYPIILIPIGVIGASNMVNMLAGYNGLETGMGIIYTATLGIYAYLNHSNLASLIAFIMLASLLAFFIFNKYPAKIFPGNSLTYLLGATLAVLAIIGNIEKAVIICSIPFFIEFILKLRGRFQKQSYGYEKNGKIHNLYGKQVYSIPHIFTRTGRFTEKQVVLFTVIIELIFAGLIWII